MKIRIILLLVLIALFFVPNGKAEEVNTYQVTLTPDTLKSIQGGLTDGKCYPAFFLRGDADKIHHELWHHRDETSVCVHNAPDGAMYLRFPLHRGTNLKDAALVFDVERNTEDGYPADLKWIDGNFLSTNGSFIYEKAGTNSVEASRYAFLSKSYSKTPNLLWAIMRSFVIPAGMPAGIGILTKMNPYAIAGSAGMTVIGEIAQRKIQAKRERIQASLSQINQPAESDAIAALTQEVRALAAQQAATAAELVQVKTDFNALTQDPERLHTLMAAQYQLRKLDQLALAETTQQ